MFKRRREDPFSDIDINDADIVQDMKNYSTSQGLSAPHRKIWKNMLKEYMNLSNVDKVAFNECLVCAGINAADTSVIIEQFFDDFVKEDPERFIYLMEKFMNSHKGEELKLNPESKYRKQDDQQNSHRKDDTMKDKFIRPIIGEYPVSLQQVNCKSQHYFMIPKQDFVAIIQDGIVGVSTNLYNHMSVLYRERSDYAELQLKHQYGRGMYPGEENLGDLDKDTFKSLDQLYLHIGICNKELLVLSIATDRSSSSELFHFGGRNKEWAFLSGTQDVIKQTFTNFNDGTFLMQYMEGTNAYIGQRIHDANLSIQGFNLKI